MYCALLQNQHLPTYPRTEPVNTGLHNRAYIEEPHTKDTGQEYDYTDGRIHNGPYTGGDLTRSSTILPQPLTNRGPSSSVAVLGTNLQSPATQSSYLELLHPQHRHQEPSVPADNYGWQAHNRMPVPNDLNGGNRADEQIRAPHIRRADSEISSQPPTRNIPAGAIALPRVDSLAPADNYKLPSSRRLSASHNVSGGNGPDGQKTAPHLHRSDSDSSRYKPPVPPKNLQR
jgi:hypothetical protein